MENQSLKKAYVASGCFWGTEFWLKKAKGIVSTAVGYCGGHTNNPTYEAVCTGRTGHAETVEVIYDSKQVSYEDILKIYFETHDPSQKDGQGPDIGHQYRTAIFYQTEAEKNTALKIIRILEDKGINVVTELNPFEKFWEAENYHQDYYNKKGDTPYCHIYTKKF